MKTCPFCAEQIQDDAIKCRYCRSMLREGERAEAGFRPFMGLTDGDTLVREARELLASGRKIEAIKLVRRRSGIGLREARDYVEALHSGARVALGEKSCRFCKNGIPAAASTCRQCGRDQRNSALPALIVVVLLIVGLSVFFMLGN